MRLLKFKTTVTSERTLTLRVPNDVPTGTTEIIVVFAPTERPTGDQGSNLGDLRASEFFGMWRDRDDLPTSAAFARTLREQTWKRSDQ